MILRVARRLARQPDLPKVLGTSVADYEGTLAAFRGGRFRESLQLLARFKQFASGVDNSEVKTIVNKTEAAIFQRIGYPERAEQCLRRNLDSARSSKQFLNTCNAYLDLLGLYLSIDLNKAILLSRTLLSAEHSNQFPDLHLKQYQFMLGTAYLLDLNFKDAKTRLKRVLSNSPNQHLKALTLNNLAVARLIDPECLPQERAVALENLRASLSILVEEEDESVRLNAFFQQETEECPAIRNEQVIKVVENLCQFTDDPYEVRKWVNKLVAILKSCPWHVGRSHLLLLRLELERGERGKAEVLLGIVRSHWDEVLKKEAEAMFGTGEPASQRELSYLYVIRDALL